MRARRWGVLISGRGSTLSSLLDARDSIDLRLVVSSTPKAYGLLRAKRGGVPTEITPFQPGIKKIDYAALDRLLKAKGITHVFLAGFMKVVPESFVRAWQGRMVNLHPSLLPAYPGLNSIARAHEEKAEIGLTVHEVNEEVDAGKIICQRRCLNQAEVRGYSLAAAEFLVHVDEQRIIRQVAAKYAPVALSKGMAR